MLNFYRMKKSLILALIFIVQCQSFLTAQDQPNVLLIIADDLGIDAIEGFESDVANFPNTPNLDMLRQEGISYLNTWATPQCTPTRASIMSGKYGINTGVMTPPGNLEIEDESILNYLKRNTNGLYNTAVVGKWHISRPIDLNHPLEHGADYYEGIIDGTIDDYYDWEKARDGQLVQINEYVTTHLTDLAIDWITDQDQPWFLWLAHYAPHSPFQLPPDGLYSVNNPTSDRQLYNASIEALDHEIGRLLDSMDQATRQNTLVVFIGDNGTPGGVSRGYPSGHSKGSMYEGGLRVPMIISGAGVTRTGAREYGLTQVNDLYATFIEACSNDLEGGIYNSYSILESFTEENSIQRNYVYSDYEDGGTLFWAIRNEQYKLIQDDQGNKEFYRIDENLEETENLMLNLNPAEAAILEELEEEAEAIRNGWSCKDLILNGQEVTIDDCDSDCGEVDVLSNTNIGCCAMPEEPSVYHEWQVDNTRHIYSNGFPNHDYCYNPINVPEQSYHYFRVPIEPTLAKEATNIVRDNGRPARHFGVAMNGVFFSPAPGTPFIYVNKITGEFNWDWVFEPTNNQGDGMDQVRLDCATAHTNASGYHYHGEMVEYLENEQPGITTATMLNEVYQVGWAADGHPVIYKFGPDQNGNMKELLPSFRLKDGERPGDGIEAPCGPYTGKYTVDYEYVPGLGDLDECNGIASTITLETALGTETFDYFYVVTASFPEVGRCLKGSVSPDFENSADPIEGIDEDGDGFLSQFECDDSNAQINPAQEEIPYNGWDDDCDPETLDDDLDQDGFVLADDCDDQDPEINPDAEEIPNNGIDEDCDGSDLITSVFEINDTKISLYPNPVSERLHILVDGNLDHGIRIFNMDRKLIISNSNSPSSVNVSNLPTGLYIIEFEEVQSKKRVLKKILVVN